MLPLGGDGQTLYPEALVEAAEGYVPPEGRNAAVVYGKHLADVTLVLDLVSAAEEPAIYEIVDGVTPEQAASVLRVVEGFGVPRAWESLFRDAEQVLELAEGEPVPEEMLESARDLAWALDPLRVGTLMERCDWEVPREQGMHAVLPELDHMRRIGALFAVSGVAKAVDGDHSGALRDMAAAVRVADHTGQAAVLVSSNAAMSIASLSVGLAVRHVDVSLADTDARAEWLEALDRVSGEDRFAIVDAIGNEAEWLMRVSGLEILRAAWGQSMGLTFMEMGDEPVPPRSPMDEALLGRITEGARAWAAAMDEAWTSGAGQAGIDAVAAVDAEADAGAYGPASEMLSSLKRLKETDARVMGLIGDARAAAGEG